MSDNNSQDNSLPRPARRLILSVSVIASIILVPAIINWHGIDALTLAIWLVAAILAGTIKVRFPGIESSYSFSYVAVLAAISMLGFPQAILISLVTMVVQCYWNSLKRPMPIQVLFNLCNHAISAAAAWISFHGLEHLVPDLGMPARFSFAAGIFFLVNTGLVSWILAILTGRGVVDVWQNSHLLIFPYYLVGAACAATIAWRQGANTSATIWAVFPLLALLYASMRVRIRQVGS